LLGNKPGFGHFTIQTKADPPPGGRPGNYTPPEFSKTCLDVRYNKLQSFSPPQKIPAGCGPD